MSENHSRNEKNDIKSFDIENQNGMENGEPKELGSLSNGRADELREEATRFMESVATFRNLDPSERRAKKMTSFFDVDTEMDPMARDISKVCGVDSLQETCSKLFYVLH